MFEGRASGILFSISLVTVALGAGCIGFGSGCSFEQGAWATGAGGQEGACNETDEFAYGFQGSKAGGTETFQWENTKGQAEVAWGAQGGGNVGVTIQDAAGQTVFQRSFSASGQAGDAIRTDSGEPGEWTIEIRFAGFGGQMGLGIRAV